jgi:hypothetical protein
MAVWHVKQQRADPMGPPVGVADDEGLSVSPVLISLPSKLMLCVLVDCWSRVMGTLAASFYS